MTKNEKLKIQLDEAISSYEREKFYMVGIQNDILLQKIVKDIRKNPTIEKFVQFVNCLNFFYSTRLQAAVNVSKKNLKTKNIIIVGVAQYLLDNWNENMMLCYENEGSAINVAKVEELRCYLKNRHGKAAYSFATKVFHQLNSQYPILDTNVNVFMSKNNFKSKNINGVTKSVNLYADDVSYSEFHDLYLTMMKKIKWNLKKVNKFDNAIWVHVANKRKKYFPNQHNLKATNTESIA